MANPATIADPGIQATALQEKRAARAWREIAARYHTGQVWRPIAQLVVTLIPLFAILIAMYFSLGVSYFLTLALAPFGGAFLLRTFVLMHDCAHNSFFPSRRANEIVGAITGVMSLTPFGLWRRDHALHHASSGDLDRRGHGDIRTLTVREYQACTRIERFKYRLYRNPILLFGFGPLYLMVSSRKNPSGVSAKGDGTVSAQSTNLAILLLIAAMSWLIGLKAVVLIYLPVFLVAGAAGIWLFYVQHQFEDTYWEPHDDWDYAASAMRGSSYYKLPKVLEWMTGNIGLHHVHHFDPKVPSYNLGRCYVENDEFRCATVLGIRESLHTASLKLWDEDARRMVGYEAVK